MELLILATCGLVGAVLVELFLERLIRTGRIRRPEIHLTITIAASRATVWAIDADAVMVRPGPRLVDGAEAIAAALFGPETAGLTALPNQVIERLR